MRFERLKKKKWCKFICYLIIFAFLLQIAPMQLLAEELGDIDLFNTEGIVNSDGIIDSEGMVDAENNTEFENGSTEGLVSEEREIVTELPDLREANVKYFLNEDGSQTASMYNHDVHYLESDGTYEDIDNRFVDEKDKDGTEVYSNNKNAAKIKFAKNTSSSYLVSIKKDDFDLSWSLVDANKCNVKDTTEETNGDVTKDMKEEKDFVQNTISSTKYTDVFENVDLEYVLIGSKIKENFIINDTNSPSQFSFVLETKSLYAKESDEGILFCDETGETVFNMSNMVMYDTKDAESCDIELKLETLTDKENRREYQLTIIPSEEWLKDAERAYPIVLDPTITTTQTATTIYDTHVNSDWPTSNNAASYSRVVGTMTGGKKSRTYVKFVLPTQIQKSDRIVSATMHLHSNTENVNSIFYDYATSGPTMYMFPLNGDWNESTLTWNNQPSYNSSNTIDYEKIDIEGNIARRGWYDWDVTSMVDSWYNGSPNYGVMIKDTESAQYAKRVYFHSTNDVDYSDRYPMIVISYMNMIGLEDYWTYHTQSAGLAGTGYVNDFTGALTTSFEDYSWDSEILSLAVSHVYTTNYSNNVQPSLDVGKGFMLSLQERITPITINGTSLYRYVDGDGTQHYFQYSDSQWKDDSGLGLTLTINTSDYTVKDKSDNIRVFYKTTGYLNKIQDNDGNEITLSYSGGYLVHAYDEAGHMLTFNRDANNRLSYISVKDSANPSVALYTIQYTYGSTLYGGGGYLKQVKFPGKSNVSSSGGSGADNIAQFGYTDSGTLNSMKDTTNGMHVDYTYDWVNQSIRVNGFEVYDASNSLESAYTMEYSSHCTRFNEITPNLGRNQVYVFNYMGQTVSAQDQDGNALFCETGMSGGAKNKITFSSKAQQTITNLLRNHDFENGTPYFGAIGNANFSIDSSHAFSGNNCFKITTSTASSGYCVVLQGVEGTGGQSYTLSGYIKTEGCTTNGACVRLVALDGSNLVTAGESNNIISENGYMRFETSIDLSDYSSSNTYSLYMYIGLKNVNYTATAYIDSIQLESGGCANRYNLLENGNLENSTNDWTIEGNTSSYDGLVAHDTGSCYQFWGSATTSKKLYQTVPINGDAGDSYVFGCWLKSTGLPNKDTGEGTDQCLGMTLEFHNTDGTSTWKNILITPTAEEWQYVCANAVAGKDYSSVTLYLKFAYNRNYAWFDDAQLYKDSFGDSFTYDSKGNVISVVDKAANTANAAVNVNNDTTSYSDGKGQTYAFQYDGGSTTAKTHNLTRSTAPDGTYSTFTYNSFGNVTGTNQYGNYGNRKISSTISYTDNGAYKTASTDQRGLQTTYNYNDDYGLLTSTTIPVGPIDQSQTLTTTNTYNTDTRKLTQISNDFFDTTVKYTYEKNRLNSVQVGSDSVYLRFSLEYDDAGNCTTISRSSSGNSTPVVLVTYTYLDGRNLVGSQTYANGQTLNYTYDDQDRLIGVSDGSNQISEYVYNSNGLLGKSTSYGGNTFTTTNQYDLADRLISMSNSNGSGINNVTYDKNNLLTGYKSYLQDGSANLEYTTEYTYIEKDDQGNVASGVDNQKSSTLKAGSTTLSNTSFVYEAHGRLAVTLATAGNSNVSHVKAGYVYQNIGTDKTTTLLDHMAIRYSTVPDSQEAADITYYPLYDRSGNITEIETVLKDGSSSTSGYGYDKLGRLVSATNVADTGDNYAYTYDDRDNITGSTVTNGGTTTESKSYTYATDDINLLTSFSHTTTDGTLTRNYTCDTIGNPTAIAETDTSDSSTRNLALTWTQGRLLSNVSDGSTLNNTYCYNAKGNISKKTLADGSYVIYHYNGGELEYEEHFNSSDVLQEVLKYSYDADGNVEYLLYKDDNFSNANAFDLYYYIRNVAGDITDLFQIREQNGSSTTEVNRLAAHYEYDPYGNILSIDKYNNDDIGDINPIRYKDYYYDAETGWYQLTSRFYDPEVGRFLNADGYVATGQDISGNMYTYCGNNPVNRCDPSGAFWKEIGNFFKKVGNAVVNFAKKIFKATYSKSTYDVSAKSKATYPLLYKGGTYDCYEVHSGGNPSGLVSFNFIQNSINKIQSSYMNTTINISHYSFGWNTGINNLGVVIKNTDGNIAYSYEVRFSLTQTVSYVTTCQDIRYNAVDYTEIGYDNKWFLLAAGVAASFIGLLGIGALTPAFS